MKHNLLTVIQICDQGHKVTFDSQKCEIKREGSGKLVSTTAITSNNIYVLSEIRNEKRCLWHRRMGHMHFDNLVKVSKREAVKEIPQHFMQSRNQPTLYENIVNKESKHRPGSNQRNIQQQDH
jgi:hypothetical protein